MTEDDSKCFSIKVNFIEIPKNGTPCRDCKTKGFFSYYSDEQLVCPLCGYNEDEDEDEDDTDTDTDTLKKILGRNVNYCSNCNILYKIKCQHGSNGCSMDTWYGSFIQEFEYNDKLYRGMPQFDDISECLKFPFSKIKWLCMCNNRCTDSKFQCKKAYNTNNPYNNYINCCCSNNTGISTSTLN